MDPVYGYPAAVSGYRKVPQSDELFILQDDEI